MKKLVALLGCALLSACANTNTGEITYRRAAPPPPIDAATMRYSDNCHGNWNRSEAEVANDLESRLQSIRRATTAFETARDVLNSATNAKVADDTAQTRQAVSVAEQRLVTARASLRDAESRNVCPLILEARLDRQNIGYGRPIQTGDVYSLRLEHGMISELSEMGLGQRDVRGVPNPFASIGEVVILANIFEFGAANPSFSNPENVTTARVIYYSDDVSQYQDLNFSNIPLQAPVEYGGNPIGIQIIVLELDRTSGPAQALIRQLAELGTSTGLVPGGAVAETLVSLGTSLLSQNHDDMIFEYRMVLDPSATGSNLTGSPPFEEGRYVIMRNELRNTDLTWRDYRLDHNDGRVYRWDDTLNSPVAQVEHTYFTVNAVRHPTGTRPSGYSLETFETFNTNLERALNERDEPLDIITQAITAQLASAQADTLMVQLNGRWRQVVDKARLYASHLPATSEGASCQIRREAAAARDEAYISAYNNAVGFMTLYADAIDDEWTDSGAKKNVVSDTDKREILMTLTEYFSPFPTGTGVSRDQLANPATFESAFLSQPSRFADAVLGEAGTDDERSTCAILTANGMTG